MTKDDCISRQAALDTIVGQPPEPHYPSWYAAQIEKLPAVQPATSCSEIPNNSDLIDRQAAIDYCYQLINVEHQQGSDEMNYGQERVNQTETILHHLELMPSAKPERKTDDDAISKQAALDILDEFADKCIEVVGGSYERVRKEMCDLPSAQPERKKGEWLPDNRPDGGFWVCSECKFPSEAFAADVLYKFCPNCGADMRGDSDGDK